MFREKDVAGIATIHDALAYIDSGSGDIYLIVDVCGLINGTAVNPHSHLNLRVRF